MVFQEPRRPWPSSVERASPIFPGSPMPPTGTMLAVLRPLLNVAALDDRPWWEVAHGSSKNKKVPSWLRYYRSSADRCTRCGDGRLTREPPSHSRPAAFHDLRSASASAEMPAATGRKAGPEISGSRPVGKAVIHWFGLPKPTSGLAKGAGQSASGAEDGKTQSARFMFRWIYNCIRGFLN
jgi:hypothetical protein